MRRLFARPFADLVDALDTAIAGRGSLALVFLAAGCALSWWLYVPLHELMHAWGLQLGGGTVTRLDIGAGYGAKFLQPLFPYVHVGSDYAGQLVGFDARGSDAAYALCVFFPFLLTIALGVPLLLRSARGTTLLSALLLGAALPIAWAPILSIAGDYYELGSITMSTIARAAFGVDGQAWRGDDLLKVATGLWRGDRRSVGADVTGVVASFVLGVTLAFGTYALGRWPARVFGAGIAVSRVAGR